MSHRNNFVYLKSLLDLTYLLSILLLDHWPMLYYVPAFGMLEVCPFELSCHFIFSTRAILLVLLLLVRPRGTIMYKYFSDSQTEIGLFAP